MKGEKYSKFIGWVKVLVAGIHPEEFINLAARSGLVTWNYRTTGKELSFITNYQGLKKLKMIQGEYRFSYTLLAERGIIPGVRRLWRRKFLLVGLFCFCLALYYLSGLVWVVKMDGLSTLDPAVVTEFLGEYGLKKWGKIRDLNLNAIEQNLYLKFPEIAWVAIDRKGAKISLRVVEKEFSPLEYGAVIDIVAAYDGIIFEMMVLKGIPQVEPGMTVAKGDVLITGSWEGENAINAAGSVQGKVFLLGEGEAATQENEKTYTGREKLVKILLAWGKEIPLSRKPKFAQYEILDTSQALFGKDVQLLHRKYTEITLEKKEYTPAAAADLARQRALVAVHSQLGEKAKILAKEIEVIPVNDAHFSCRVLLTAETSMGAERVRVKGDKIVDNGGKD